MLRVLRHRHYARLFSAQVLSLLGAGLLTVALGLLAYDVSPAAAGKVLGTAMTIKIAAYVFVAPVMNALTLRLPVKRVLVAADVVRAGVALCLPFVDSPWQIYVLIFLLQAASATFTPSFQATIPEIFPDEEDYTQALALSRMAYDLESVVSPLLAALLLGFVTYHSLFLGTVAGFTASALLVVGTRLPRRVGVAEEPFAARLTTGIRIFARQPELRALMAVNVAESAATAMVIINTVVLVRASLGESESRVALLFALYGMGSLLCAPLLPRLLERWPARRVMLSGSALSTLLLLSLTVTLRQSPPSFWAHGAVWALLGAAACLTMTPSSLLLRRCSTEATRSSVFTAQFSLSHAAYLATYPLAGFLSAARGLPAAALALGLLSAAAWACAALLWRSSSELAASNGRMAP